MAHLDVAQVAFSGFGVIRRHPVAVLVWAVMIFVLAVGPLMLGFSLIAPTFQELFAQAAKGIEPTPEKILQLQAQWMTVNPLLTLSSLLVRVVLTCAIFRAVLEPRASAFAYLRLGMAEVFVALVAICMTVLIVIGVLIVGVAGGVLTALLYAVASARAAAIAMGAATVLTCIGLALWVGLRLSLALPMSFADRNFRLFESWAATRGQAGRLFLVLLLVIVIIMLLEIVIFGLVGGGVVAFLLNGTTPDEAAITAFFSRPVQAWSADLLPWVVGGGLFIGLVAAVFGTVATAPWAAAYRALVPPPAEPQVAAEG